jgi:hypothetical protein
VEESEEIGETGLEPIDSDKVPDPWKRYPLFLGKEKGQTVCCVREREKITIGMK